MNDIRNWHFLIVYSVEKYLISLPDSPTISVPYVTSSNFKKRQTNLPIFPLKQVRIINELTINNDDNKSILTGISRVDECDVPMVRLYHLRGVQRAHDQPYRDHGQKLRKNTVVKFDHYKIVLLLKKSRY